MHHPTGAYLGLINATQALGGCAAYPLMSIVAQRSGRKRSLYIGLSLILLGSALQAGAATRQMFIASRLLVGMSSAFFGAVPLLVGETAYPTHRGVVTALFMTLYYVGAFLASWATYGTRNIAADWAWRIPSLLQAGIPILILPLVVCAPESPRWLVAQGRVQEARATLVRYHAGGDETSPLVAFEMAEIEETLRLELQFRQAVGYLDMFKTRGNRHRLFISLTLGVFAQ